MPKAGTRRWVSGLLLACVGLLGAYVLLRPADPALTRGALTPGRLAPDFALQDLAGRTVRLGDLRGQAVALNFWATWCPPCREEMPDLERVYQKYRERGLVVYGVNLEESPVTVEAFVRRYELSFPILLDRRADVTRLYQIIPLPTTFFIDRDGVIRDKVEGMMSYATMERLVQNLLGDGEGERR